MEHLEFAASEMKYCLAKQNSLTGKAFTLLIKKVTVYIFLKITTACKSAVEVNLRKVRYKKSNSQQTK